MSQKFVQMQPMTLAGSGVAIGATTITLTQLVDIEGNTLAMTDFGSKGWATLEAGNSTQEEQISFTGVTQNSNGTATLSGVSNVLNKYPYTETSGVLKSHAGGTSFVVSNTTGFYDAMTSNANDEIVTGKWTFPGTTNRPTLSSDADTTTDTDLVTRGQLARTAVASAVASTTTTVGYVKLSSTSGTPTAPVVVETADTRVPTQGENDALVGNNTDIAVGTGNKFITQTGLQHNAEKYAADSGSNDTYVITLSPVPTSYTAGMVVHFKANTINTGAATLNVNSLGAKTIVKGVNTTLADGDIKAGQFCTVIYDGTNFVLQNNAITDVDGSLLTGIRVFKNGTTTRDLSTASGNQTIAHGLGVAPKFVRITAIQGASTSFNLSSGVYNGTTNSSVSHGTNGNSQFYTDSNSNYTVNLWTNATNDTSPSTATVTVDATNITLAWTRAGSATGTAYIMWEAWI